MISGIMFKTRKEILSTLLYRKIRLKIIKQNNMKKKIIISDPSDPRINTDDPIRGGGNPPAKKSRQSVKNTHLALKNLFSVLSPEITDEVGGGVRA